MLTTGQEKLREVTSTLRRGEFDVARRLCEEILRDAPDDGSACNLFATVLCHTGDDEAAVRYAERAAAIQQNSWLFLFNLGECYRKVNRLDPAIAAYQRALALARVPQVYRGLGQAYERSGRFADAVETLKKAIGLDRNNAVAYEHLAGCLARMNRWGEAAGVCREAIARDPLRHINHARLGDMLLRMGDLRNAARNYERAVQLQPSYGPAYLGLAIAANEMGRFDLALRAAERAIAVGGRNPAAHLQLGWARYGLGQLRSAALELETALQMEPENLQALVVLANVELERLGHSTAIALFERAVDVAPESPVIFSKLLLARNYDPDADDDTLARAHCAWGMRVASAVTQSCPQELTDPDPERKLRIGYVSADLRDHSVAYFIESILASHDRKEYEPVVFSDVGRPDPITRRLRQIGLEWHDTFMLGDAAMADLIAKRQIDVLVDLGGHTAHNRLMVFARRPAPIQASYLGYPNTTGLPRSTMQYRFTDLVADPLGTSDGMHSERLVRLPGTFLCYKPPADAPDVGAEASNAAHVTFGCFNAIQKLSFTMLDLWASLLREVPGSRIILKGRSLGDRSVCEAILERFAGVDFHRDRVVFLARDESTRAHLGRYSEIDIALDTYPYNGTTTTCEALWMGVPVVTLAGSSHRSRVGASILSAVGLQELIAPSTEQYLRIAANLANNHSRRNGLRANLRGNVRASCLIDAPNFTRNLEAAYRSMWKAASAGEALIGSELRCELSSP
jgi:protein O-GlcNAc transferase